MLMAIMAMELIEKREKIRNIKNDNNDKYNNYPAADTLSLVLNLRDGALCKILSEI